MYYKALGEKQTTSVLTAVDVETGMCMAVQLEDKTQHVQYPVSLPSTIPDGMWQNSCNPQQHRSSVRPRRLYHLLAQGGGNSNGQQHSSKASTSIHITSTRERWTFPQNIDGPSQSSQNSNWRPAMASSSTASIPSCRGLSNTQHTCSTGIPSTQMETQATTEDGAKNTKHQSVSLVKQFFTCYQQQNICRRWKQGSIQPSGWVRTTQQTRTYLASATKWSEQGPKEDK